MIIPQHVHATFVNISINGGVGNDFVQLFTTFEKNSWYFLPLLYTFRQFLQRFLTYSITLHVWANNGHI